MGGGGPVSERAAWVDAGTPMVLPLVVRIERSAPPTRTDALEAAARAVLSLLADPRAVDGEWADAVRRWEAGRIRKVVRRARGSDWQRATALPGIGVVVGTAEVRVYPPIPVDDWPRDLARLQVSGTDLEDPEPPGPATVGTPMLWINPELELTAGKAMAQAGHGAQLAWWELDPPSRGRWAERGFSLAVRTAAPGRWERLVRSGLPVVQDAGFTEIDAGTCTVVADLTGAGWLVL